MYHQISTILEQQGYAQVTLNIPGLYFHLCEQDNIHYAVVTIDETAGGLFSREQFLHISEQIRSYLREKEIYKTIFLYLLITDSDTAARTLFLENDCYWVINPRSSRLLVFENWHPYFHPLRRALEQLMQECAAPPASQERNPVKSSPVFRRLFSCTSLLVLVNVLIFILTDWSAILHDSSHWFEIGAESWDAVLYGHEYYRIITSMFLHGDIDHLFNNMLMLLFIGLYIERQTGSLRFLLIYFFSGILAGCTSMVYNMLQSAPTSSVGASGAVFGLMGALLTIVLAQHRAKREINIRALILIIFINLYSGFTSPNIDNAAHIGGFLAGIFITAFLYRISPEKFESG